MIEALVAEWARAEDNVRAAALIGSRARTDTPADEWSDHDFVIFARDPDSLLEREDWVRALGPVRLTFLEATGVGGHRERRVLFADGTDADFAVVPIEQLDHPAVAEVAWRGTQILVDKDGAPCSAPRGAACATAAVSPRRGRLSRNGERLLVPRGLDGEEAAAR